MSFFSNIFIAFILIVLVFSIKIVYQYQRGVLFTFGTYSRTMKPGLKIVIPFIQELVKVDMRQRVVDLEPQEVMTKDQVNLKIDGVIFYHVEKAENVIINVENIEHQLSAKATSELKEVVGNMTMSDALKSRDKIASELKRQLDKAISDLEDGKKHKNNQKKDWGVVVKMIQINNIELPSQLVRAMAKEAEAEREKKAISIRAEGEEEASKKYSEASKRYSKSKEALRLRELKTYEEIGKENNTMMIVIPSEMTTTNGSWVLPFAQSLKEKKKGKKNG